MIGLPSDISSGRMPESPTTAMGRNMAMVVRVLTTIAIATAETARASTRERSPGSRSSRARSSDSPTTMALSMTMPVASRKPIRVKRFMRLSWQAIASRARAIDSGSAAHTTRARRTRPRKTTRKSAENSPPHSAAISSSWAAASISRWLAVCTVIGRASRRLSCSSTRTTSSEVR